jgi:hypothetical protein
LIFDQIFRLWLARILPMERRLRSDTIHGGLISGKKTWFPLNRINTSNNEGLKRILTAEKIRCSRINIFKIKENSIGRSSSTNLSKREGGCTRLAFEIRRAWITKARMSVRNSERAKFTQLCTQIKRTKEHGTSRLWVPFQS